MLNGNRAAIEVRVTRGEEGKIESRHACHAVVCNGAGAVLASFGEQNFLTFPRSAIKMLQALAFVEKATTDPRANAFALEQECLALACGSHSGEERHVALVRRWLDALGLAEHHLACGIHAPLDKASAAELVRQGETPQPPHHMCSGKHCGMLTLARAQGWEVEGYCEHDHPVQQRVREVCAQLFEVDLTLQPRGRDGCSVPTFAVPLRALAHGMARFASPERLEKKRAQAAQQIFHAMTSRPFFVAGSRQADTLLTEQGQGRFVVKTGAEGVYTAAVPKRSLGIAVKCADGATRAAKAAMTLLLQKLALLPDEENSFANRNLKNFRGLKIGSLEAHLPD